MTTEEDRPRRYRESEIVKWVTTGPTAWRDLAKARLKNWWPKIFEKPTFNASDHVVAPLMICFIGLAATLLFSELTSDNTGYDDQRCIDTCDWVGGFMVGRNKYGCVCHTKKGQETFQK